MKKLFLSFLLLALSAYALSVQGLAQFITGESIKSFDADIIVNADNSINVRESILYNSGGIAKHGIYRDIHPYSALNKKMSIDNISVRDEMGNSYIFSTSKEGKNLRIKIGDPNATFVGEKTYIINYTASKAVSHLEYIDEIYWNVTGNEWQMPIISSSASIILPSGAVATQTACYFGAFGATNKCDQASSVNGKYTFNFPSLLSASEGLTVAVGFNKGVVAPYSLSDNMLDTFYQYLPYIIATLLPIITFTFSYRYWRSNGRDDRETNVIVAEYDVPDNLTPLEVVAIAEEKIDNKIISAEIIYLATKGYIKINEIENTILFNFKSKDYELVKLKEAVDELNESDKSLMNALFKGNNSVKVSSLKNTFYKSIKSIMDPAVLDLKDEGYYKNLGRLGLMFNPVPNGGIKSNFMLTIFSFWIIFVMVAYVSELFSSVNSNSIIILGFIVTAIIIFVFYYISPAKTEKGVGAKEKILGLKEYMQIAEKDRLIFANAPESKPEIFEKLLPYAMALGVADVWAKEFKDIYLVQPSWYSSTNTNSFNSAMLANSLTNFSTASLAASMPPSSRGGGSSGGGFSGGGGGGGGGGSW